MERSLSDNKNTVTAERTNLSNNTRMGSRLKEHAGTLEGASSVNTLSKGIISSVERGNKCYLEQKREGEAEKELFKVK